MLVLGSGHAPMDKRVKSPGSKVKRPRADRSQYDGYGDSNETIKQRNTIWARPWGLRRVASNCTQNILRPTSRSG